MLLTRSLRLPFTTRYYSSISSNSILSKAITLVPKYGWKDALVESCRSLQMSDQATSLFAPDDLVKYHYEEQLKNLQNYAPQSTETFAKLRELLIFRLVDGNRHLGPGRLAEAISLTLSIHPFTTSFECLSQISDELWYKAGDRSPDTTWYTRRGALLGIYATCEAFQSRDTSQGFRDTKALATKLITGLENAEYAEKSVTEWLDFNIRGTFNVLRTWR